MAHGRFAVGTVTVKFPEASVVVLADPSFRQRNVILAATIGTPMAAVPLPSVTYVDNWVSRSIV